MKPPNGKAFPLGRMRRGASRPFLASLANPIPPVPDQPRRPAPGRRIRCLSMLNDPDPIPPGTIGSVVETRQLWDGSIQIWVEWENRRVLALCCPPDQWELVDDY